MTGKGTISPRSFRTKVQFQSDLLDVRMIENSLPHHTYLVILLGHLRVLPTTLSGQRDEDRGRLMHGEVLELALTRVRGTQVTHNTIPHREPVQAAAAVTMTLPHTTVAFRIVLLMQII